MSAQEVLQFFKYEHLALSRMRDVSRHFGEVAHFVAQHEAQPTAQEDMLSTLVSWIETEFAANPETTWAQTKIMDARSMVQRGGASLNEVLRKVLEAKDCGVRSLIYKHD